MTPQHPAAPEGETDASGLREVAYAILDLMPLDSTGHIAKCTWDDADENPKCGCFDLPGQIATLIAERLRVVEGERDAAHEAGYWVGYREGKDEAETRDLNYDEAIDRAEVAEAAHANIEADYDRRGERLWRLATSTGYAPCDSDNDATAEMVIADALAVHAALVAGVEALADEWGATDASGCGVAMSGWDAARALRTLLAGGGA